MCVSVSVCVCTRERKRPQNKPGMPSRSDVEVVLVRGHLVAGKQTSGSSVELQNPEIRALLLALEAEEGALSREMSALQGPGPLGDTLLAG